MRMRIVQWAATDPLSTKACGDLSVAVRLADDPFGMPMSERMTWAMLKPIGDPAQIWYVPGDSPGSAVAMYRLRLPERENRQRAGLDLKVHPDYRRRGIGSALLRHAAQRAAEDGRSVLGTAVFQGLAGEKFARHHGATATLDDARRVLVLSRLAPGAVAALRDSAALAAAGYSTVTWAGRTPDEYLEGVAAVSNAMSDAPHSPGSQARVWDAQRVREHLDNHQQLFGTRSYWVAAVEDATGEMAAITAVDIDPENPSWANQEITAVARPHRGHRLGLLVKAVMMDVLAEAEPALERIVTWNAAVNEHMIAINEALGYELLEPQSRHYQLPVADALG
jgi:GNAT superfamily N-acetyltransferase